MRAADPQRYGTIVVIGGGCYGSYYVRQLRRARTAGALAWRRLLVVDRNPACRVHTELDAEASRADVRVVEQEWSEFIERWLREGETDDALVPSPLMPHLLFDWLLRRARARWPERRIERIPLEQPPPTPWQRGSPGGTHYVSFATWTCPINCIEPRLCPVTRGPRSWSLPPAIREYTEAERRRGHDIHGPLVFHCSHRAYGVGMIDTHDVLEADRAVARAGTSPPARVLIGTVSHCHGALDLMAIGEDASGAR